MKKWKLGALMFLVFMFAVSPSASILQAYDFEGNEEECSIAVQRHSHRSQVHKPVKRLKNINAGQEKELKKENQFFR